MHAAMQNYRRSRRQSRRNLKMKKQKKRDERKLRCDRGKPMKKMTLEEAIRENGGGSVTGYSTDEHRYDSMSLISSMSLTSAEATGRSVTRTPSPKPRRKTSHSSDSAVTDASSSRTASPQQYQKFWLIPVDTNKPRTLELSLEMGTALNIEASHSKHVLPNHPGLVDEYDLPVQVPDLPSLVHDGGAARPGGASPEKTPTTSVEEDWDANEKAHARHGTRAQFDEAGGAPLEETTTGSSSEEGSSSPTGSTTEETAAASSGEELSPQFLARDRCGELLVQALDGIISNGIATPASRKVCYFFRRFILDREDDRSAALSPFETDTPVYRDFENERRKASHRKANRAKERLKEFADTWLHDDETLMDLDFGAITFFPP